MKCPHCLENFFVKEGSSPLPGNRRYQHIGKDVESTWWLEIVTCPACNKVIVSLISSVDPPATFNTWGREMPREIRWKALIRPKGTNRPPVPSEVPPKFAEDYLEACLVLADSPKASAALSRRCLQLIIQEVVGAKGNTLYEEIEQAKQQGNLISSLVDLLDVPRRVGNIAAHPTKDKIAGLIVDVEPWEAEWCLDVIEALYDHCFVVPARNAERLRQLDQKLSP